MNDAADSPVAALRGQDLGPVAWVLDELRRSLEAAARGLQRYRREADAAGAAFHVPGLQHLLQAGHLLHQCAGVLQMVEQTACAALAQAMETAVQRFAEQQQPCTDEAVAQIEQAGFALVAYLQALLSGKAIAPVALFPQFSEVQVLAGAPRSRPVDLWDAPAVAPAEALPLSPDVQALQQDPTLRSRFDQAVLRVVKSGDTSAAHALHDMALGLAVGSAMPLQQQFWQCAAAYFQAVGLGLVPSDVYTKRIASGVLTQYAAFARGEADPAAALHRELLFYCAGAAPPEGAAAATLVAVRAAHGLQAGEASGYAPRRFGRFDFGLLAQARKRIAAASETWTAVAGGDTHRLKAAHEQFESMADALGRLHDDSAVLAQALVAAAEAAGRVGTAPPAPLPAALAHEVAMALLYLETAYADLDRSTAELNAHATQLADRLVQAHQDDTPAPPPDWLQALYHDVHAPQAMDSVVTALHRTLAEVEQALDQFFRAPREKGVLGKVLARLTQVRGVLSVLELPQAADAVLHMRAMVEGYMADAGDDAPARNASFERLGSSLAALGFMVDMLAYQPGLARQRFVHDAALGLFRLQGDSAAAPGTSDATPPVDTATDAAEADDGLLQVFLGEARTVVQEGFAAVQSLEATPDDPAPLAQLRRAFHTLKGSARMVHAHDFGNAAWCFEEPLNAWIDAHHPVDPALRQTTLQALQALGAWIDDMASGRDGAYRLPMLQALAEALHQSPPALPLSSVAPATPPSDAANDDHARQVGPLRIALPLYNAFLNDADEWSRQLQTELGEWALQQPLPPTASSAALARALADSAATVGFAELARLADLLDRVLAHLRQSPPDGPVPAAPVVDAAEEIRRLLHQFAAGFVKPARESVVLALQTLMPRDPTGPAPADSDDTPDAIDAIDAIDAALFPVFEDEAVELLPRLAAALRQWHGSPGDTGARQQALHTLHTLKGSARLAGALQLGELAHRLEGLAEQLGADALPQQIAALLAHADTLQQAFGQLRAQQHRNTPPPDAPAAARQVRRGADPSVRVRAQLLDQLVADAGEVLITRARMEARVDQLGQAVDDLGGGLERLRHQLRALELQAESQLQSSPASAHEAGQAGTAFDPLALDRFTRTQESTRIVAETLANVVSVQRQLQRAMQETAEDLATQGRQARALQRDLLRTRLVAFETIAERLHGAVRRSAAELGRPTRLDIVGGSIALDRSTLERIAPVLEHLLRNAVVHGIEEAPVRAAAGKPATGTIQVTLAHEGADVAITVRDDGGGLDLPRIQARAVALGLRDADVPLTTQDAAALVFRPGFTTAPAVTTLAGRGIGMDVVHTEVQALAGRIETDSAAGAGTQFRLVLPMASVATPVLLVRAGARTFGIPTHLVAAVRRVPPAVLAQSYASEQFEEDGALTFYWAGALLQCGAAPPPACERHASVLVLHSGQQRLALHVDEVLGHQEVVAKSLGPQLSRLPGLAGLSVLASGAVLLLYDPVALAAVHGLTARQAQREGLRHRDAGMAGSPPCAPVAPLVLVVDDSVTVRSVMQRLLQRAGYRVALAADGVQALAQLRAERPVVLLTDIEMPQMDGYALAQAVRADPQLATLPIVAITSRTADPHRTHALAVGIDHHLGKPYGEEELLGLVRRYAGADPPP